MVGQAVPTEDHDCCVMPPVQNNEFLFAQDNKSRITQFQRLGENKKVEPGVGTLVENVWMAEGVVP